MASKDPNRIEAQYSYCLGLFSMLELPVDADARKRLMADLPELGFLIRLERFQQENIRRTKYTPAPATETGFAGLKSLAKIAGTETRLRIVLSLTVGDMNVVALAKRVGVSASTLTEHLSILEREGIVMSRTQGRMRIYNLSDSEKTRELARLVKAWSSR